MRSEKFPASALEVRSYRRLFAGVAGGTGFVIEADFGVGPQERLVLTGPSGSGKTTLLRFIAGLDAGLDPEGEGSVTIAGNDVTREPPESRNLGVVFQEPVVFPHLSVVENAAFALRMRGVGASARRNEVLPWLERVGLKDRLEADPEHLSGGEKQRLALVRAVAWRPAALLLDEPFSALDPRSREALGELLISIHQKLTIPLILVTHDLQEARRVSTRTLECEVLSGSPVRHTWCPGRENR